MRLADVANGGTEVEFAELTGDRELAREIQGRLSQFGLLDPPVDGKFGPASSWALAEFCRSTGGRFDMRLTPDIARRLASSPTDAAFPLRLDRTDLASVIVAAMLRRGYWIARHPDCVNIVYVEGMDPDGTVNENASNAFNDTRFLLRVEETGEPVIAGSWEGTTEPGRYWTEHPMSPIGAARIAFGQYKAWVVGTHHAGTAGAHEALVQVDELTVYRDLDRDYRRAGDRRYTGLFAINQHWGYDLPKGDLGRSSAGCLVGRRKDGHREFMRMAKSDARFKANRAYRFITAVLPAAAIGETSFDPSTPH